MVKVSIIMGVYNCKDKVALKRSVESIIAQTFKDWEFIICDDGSTDNTLEVLNQIASIDPRIHIISYKKNKGLNYALNTCLKYAKGVYIARQDDDDISMKERLEKEVNFLDTHPEYAIVGTLADVFDYNGIWGEYIVEEKPTKKSFYWNSPFMHPNVVMRKVALDNCDGYRIAKETRRCEDLDLFMRMYAKGYKGYNIQEKLYEYRIVNDPKKKYRPMKYRIDEAVVRYKGYKAMRILNIKGMFYVFKPIIIGLIPQKILYHIKQKQY